MSQTLYLSTAKKVTQKISSTQTSKNNELLFLLIFSVLVFHNKNHGCDNFKKLLSTANVIISNNTCSLMDGDIIKKLLILIIVIAIIIWCVSGKDMSKQPDQSVLTDIDDACIKCQIPKLCF